MAIDSHAKRNSMLLFGLPFRPILPVPDASVDKADRLVFLYLYSGIDAAPASTAVHNVYRGVGGLATVDWATPVGTAGNADTTITLTGLGHAVATRYTYGVRPVSPTPSALITPDFSNTAEFVTDAAGEWVGNRPLAVSFVDAEVLSGGQIRVTWVYRRDGLTADPNDFGIYRSATPSISPGSPTATKAFTAPGRYSHTFTLVDGASYWFAVTSRTSAPVESPLSEIIGPFVADATAPAAPTVAVSQTF